MSGDPEQDYIGDGLSENIISALSVSSQIFVIARNTTFTYKGKSVDIKQVAEDLGVQYVLEGSVQKSGDRLRVAAQFIDALSGHHLWSEVYNRKMKELFDMQDEITKKIVASLQVELGGGEDARLLARSTDSLEAWKHLIKGRELSEKLTKEDNAKAREHFKAALKLDPEYVPAIVGLSITHARDAPLRFSDSPDFSWGRHIELVREALKLDEQDPMAHSQLAWIYSFEKQYEKAIYEGKRAITLNPNYGEGYVYLGAVMCWSGRFDEAIKQFNRGLRFNPKTDPYNLMWLVKSYIFMGRYEEALEVCNLLEKHTRMGRLPEWVVPSLRTFVYSELGRVEEARAYMVETLKMYPEFSLEMIIRIGFYKNPDHLSRELDAYIRAGFQ
jgi:adenylate cyclase